MQMELHIDAINLMLLYAITVKINMKSYLVPSSGEDIKVDMLFSRFLLPL